MATTSKRKPTSIKKKAPVKPTAAQPVVAKPVAAKPTAAKPIVAKTATPANEPHVLRKKELIERVVARSGVKKKDAKPAIEAMLVVLGEALSNGEELNLQPMGKIMINRVIDKPNATVIVAKVRRRKEGAGGTVVKIAPNS
ncbi:HU family DNA-binding protein [Profundibacter sp.]